MISSILLSLLSGPAWAQATPGSGFDAHGFRLAALDAYLRDPLVVQRPGAFEEQSWFAGGVIEYAAQPLVFENSAGIVTELDNLVAANLSAGYAPTDRIRLDVSAPLFLYAEGEEETFGAGVGDIRATSMITLVRPEGRAHGGGFGTAILANIDLPTGRPEDWLGQTTLSGGVGVAVTYEAPRLTLGATAGSQLRPNTALDQRPAPTKGGDAFVWGGSLGYLLSDTSAMNVEVHGEIASDDDIRTAIGTPIEALLSMRNVRSDGGFLTVGLGTGLTRGAGASPLRLLVGGGFGAQGEKKPGDMDGDGINDYDDKCPATPETLNGFSDEDGCRDEPAVLTFRVVGPDGEPVVDAPLVVEGPLNMDGLGSLTFQGEAVQPNTPWLATASSGECLFGVKDYAVSSRGGAVTIDVPLAYKRSGLVRVEVTDPDGKPVDNVALRFRSAEEACSPSFFDDFATGGGEVNVGPGLHFAFVSAEGFSIHQESFMMQPDGKHVIKAVLKPSLARLDTTDPNKTVIQILDKVYFDTGKATIQERSFELLDQVASVILSNSIRALEIGGHTDSQGRASTNQDLSERRALAVKDYLIQKGVSESVLASKGYGEEVPISDNTTAEGRSINRRVEFRVLDENTVDGAE